VASSQHHIGVGNLPAPTQFVDIFIAFDEAHKLGISLHGENQSRFIVLRRILNLLSADPLFVFFLSTTGKITQFDQLRGQDASNRINDGTLGAPRPYIYLGFDQLMHKKKVLEEWKTLHDVTSLACVARMGRPL
jgi:hypothetical protein